MKRLMKVILSMMILCGCTSKPNDTSTIDQNGTIIDDPTLADTLVIYFNYADNVDDQAGVDVISSASLNGNVHDNVNNLAVMADEIATQMYADTFKIEINEIYPSDYDDVLVAAQTDQEQETVFTFKHELAHLDQYQTIYLGTPTWWGTLPQPVVGFLQSYDFSDKTIIPFGIHGGSGFGSCVRRYHELTEADVSDDGLTIDFETSNEDVIKEVDDWLKALKEAKKNKS